MLKIGVIGDRNHAERMINIVNESDKAKAKIIYHPKRKPKFKEGTNKFGDLLICDAIMILSPNSTHFDYLMALKDQYSGYVFCEKPPVSSKNELKSVKKLNPEKTFFNFNFRFNKWATHLQEFIKNGDIGEIVHAEVSWAHGLAFKESYKGSWRSNRKEHLHGVLETVVLHPLDLLIGFLGKIDEYFYRPGIVANSGTAYDTCILTTRHLDGATASIFASYATPLTERLCVIGTNGIFNAEDGIIEMRSPRDTFNHDGQFIRPPIQSHNKIDNEKVYKDSLSKSLDYFFSTCITKKTFPKELFDQSLATNQAILEIGNSIPSTNE